MVTVTVVDPPSMKIQVGGYGGGQTSGGGGCGRRPWWREKQRGSAGSRNRVREASSFAVFGPKFLRPWSMKIKSIYRRWKGTFFLFQCKISALGSSRKHPNHRLKVAMMNCQFCAGKWLVGLANLGRCHHLCSLNQPKRLTLACSQVSQDHLRVHFIQFGEETRRQMPWEGGHPTSLAGEEDKRYLTIQSFNL